MKIEKMFVEQPRVENSEADPFEVSDAHTILDYVKNVYLDESIWGY